MAVAAGSFHSIVVGVEGDLFSCGHGDRGCLGTGDVQGRNAFARISGVLAPVRQVAAGGFHTGIVTDSGDLFMWGWNRFGQLGLGDRNIRSTPVRLARALFYGEKILMVACGDYLTVAVTEGGSVYTYGRGSDGQLWPELDGNQLVPILLPKSMFHGERIVMVAAGNLHMAALSHTGHLFTWGHGGHGRLGHNDCKDQRFPRKVDPKWFKPTERMVFVAAGATHSVALAVDGRLYTWGLGNHGALGHGDISDRLVPELVRGGDFGGGVMAACGGQHSLLVTRSGALWACGQGECGQLALGDLAPRHIFERVYGFGGAKIVAAAAGEQHSAAITEAGVLWTWGAGYYGQVGHGDTEQHESPKAVDRKLIAVCGRFHVLPSEHALAFGMSLHGRLGSMSPARFLDVELVHMIVSKAFSGPFQNIQKHAELTALMGGHRFL